MSLRSVARLAPDSATADPSEEQMKTHTHTLDAFVSCWAPPTSASPTDSHVGGRWRTLFAQAEGLKSQTRWLDARKSLALAGGTNADSTRASKRVNITSAVADVFGGGSARMRAARNSNESHQSHESSVRPTSPEP